MFTTSPCSRGKSCLSRRLPVCASLSERVRGGGGHCSTPEPPSGTILRVLPSSLQHCSTGHLKLVSSLVLPVWGNRSFIEGVNLNVTHQKMFLFYPLPLSVVLLSTEFLLNKCFPPEFEGVALLSSNL